MKQNWYRLRVVVFYLPLLLLPTSFWALPASAHGVDLALGEMVVAQSQTPLYLSLVALIWGSAHALSPGHGKTMMGAYLVGSHATVRHVLFLGLTTTITHTAGVFALGLVALFASYTILTEQLYPWLSLVSGAIVVAIGINLVIERMQETNHSHSHPHSHPHSHHHHHHTQENSQGIHSHLSADSESVPSWRSLLALGISGGIVPCPAALVLLLSAIALNQIGLGLVLVLGFSLGLALTLTGLGLLLLKGKQLLSQLPIPSQLWQKLPLVSAFLVTLIGLGISAQACLKLGWFPLGNV